MISYYYTSSRLEVDLCVGSSRFVVGLCVLTSGSVTRLVTYGYADVKFRGLSDAIGWKEEVMAASYY